MEKEVKRVERNGKKKVDKDLKVTLEEKWKKVKGGLGLESRDDKGEICLKKKRML